MEKREAWPPFMRSWAVGGYQGRGAESKRTWNSEVGWHNEALVWNLVRSLVVAPAWEWIFIGARTVILHCYYASDYLGI